MVNFGKFDTFIFDLDGTLWNYPNLIPGVAKIIKLLEDNGKQRLYVSNFNLLSRRGALNHLRSLGVMARLEELITSAYAVAEYLKGRKGKVMAFGHGINQELMDNGIKVSNTLPVDYLVVGHDINFNYQKLSLALEAMRKGAKLLVPSFGPLWPAYGKLLPGTGALVEPIETISGKKATLLGKPSEFMRKLIDANRRSPRSKTVLFGDEADSDIAIGKRSGYFTVLVKTGVDKRIGKIKPNAVINSVADIRLQ